jgi:hypothetical protein
MTCKRTKIGVPARLINNPGPIWQFKAVRNFGGCVQHKDIVCASSLFSLLIVRVLGQRTPDEFTLSYYFVRKFPSTLLYFVHKFLSTHILFRRPPYMRLDSEEEIAGRRAGTVEDDME